MTPHQVSLSGIRGLVEAEITDRGWVQQVQELNQSQSGQQSAILDHIYCIKDDFVEHIYVKNTTGTDHYAVGERSAYCTSLRVQILLLQEHKEDSKSCL